MVARIRVIGVLVAGTAWLVAPALAQTTPPPTQNPPPTQTPVPRPSPFPGAGGAAGPARPQTPADATPQTTPAAAPAGLSDPRLAGIPIFPEAALLESIDLGNGQRSFLFGTNAAYADVVTFYRAQLRNNGREIFRTPAMQQWDLGRFDSQRMLIQPSIVVKNYEQPGGGYMHASGATLTRYVTVIQIVPAER